MTWAGGPPRGDMGVVGAEMSKHGNKVHVVGLEDELETYLTEARQDPVFALLTRTLRSGTALSTGLSASDVTGACRKAPSRHAWEYGSQRSPDSRRRTAILASQRFSVMRVRLRQGSAWFLSSQTNATGSALEPTHTVVRVPAEARERWCAKVNLPRNGVRSRGQPRSRVGRCRRDPR